MKRRFRLLVGFDFSPGSRAALEEARTLALRAGARIELVCVLPRIGAPLRDLHERATVVRRLEHEIAELLLDGIDARLHLEEGDPVAGLLRAIDEESPELVLLGRDTRRNLRNAVLGGVASRVVALSPAPVLVARERPPAQRPKDDERQILVAVDFGAPSISAAGEAGRLAVALKSAVRLIHVLPPRPLASPEELTVVEMKLDALAVELRRFGVIDVSTAVLRGDPVRVLRAEAENDDRCAAIAVGARPRGPMQRRIFGSVGNALLRTTIVPVLVVHEFPLQQDARRTRDDAPPAKGAPP